MSTNQAVLIEPVAGSSITVTCRGFTIQAVLVNDITGFERVGARRPVQIRPTLAATAGELCHVLRRQGLKVLAKSDDNGRITITPDEPSDAVAIEAGPGFKAVG